MEPIVFFRTGWMKHYEGLDGDPIKGGGAYVDKHGTGFEVFNFRPYRGKNYGFVKASGKNELIDVSRIGAVAGADFVEGVTVVWTARHPQGGVRIVGTYRDATVYRNYQEPPEGARRTITQEKWQTGYYVTAPSEACVLLPEDDRLFAVPTGKGGFGQSNVWYADSDRGQAFRAKALEYMKTYRVPRKPGSPKRRTDPEMRSKVENAAIALIWERYERKGYSLESVEKDNVGWDLEAEFESIKLLCEVKGLSGNQLRVELTPNEYANMLARKDQYRLCVVINALDAKRQEFFIFSFSRATGQWESEDGRVLKLQERTSAVAFT